MENPLDDRYKQAGEMPGYEDCPQTYRVFLVSGRGVWASVRRWWQQWILLVAGAKLHDQARRCWEFSESTEGRPCALTLHHPGHHAVEPLTGTGRTLGELMGELQDRHRELMNQREMAAAVDMTKRLEALITYLGWEGLGKGWRR